MTDHNREAHRLKAKTEILELIYTISRRSLSVIVLTSICVFGVLGIYWYVPKYNTVLTKLSVIPEDLFNDDGDFTTLLRAVDKQLIYWNHPDRKLESPIHPDFTWDRQKRTLLALSKLLSKPNLSSQKLRSWVEKSCHVYLAQGNGWGESFITGYFLPLVKGSKKPSALYPFPLYKVPKNMVDVPMSEFTNDLSAKIVKGRVENGVLKPMYNREDIDKYGVLSGKNLELVYLKDYMDQFFLHVQGSGVVSLPDGQFMAVNYHDKNGRAYRSLGGMLLRSGLMEKEQMSMQSIRAFFKKHPTLVNQFVFENESYVFFRPMPLDQFPLGDIEVPLTAGRSVASDHSLFPRGALVFVDTEVMKSNSNEWIKYQRFMIDQDTGGVIKGPGRFDLYFGMGEDASWLAGHQQRGGRLYYLILKY